MREWSTEPPTPLLVSENATDASASVPVEGDKEGEGEGGEGEEGKEQGEEDGEGKAEEEEEGEGAAEGDEGEKDNDNDPPTAGESSTQGEEEKPIVLGMMRAFLSCLCLDGSCVCCAELLLCCVPHVLWVDKDPKGMRARKTMTTSPRNWERARLRERKRSRWCWVCVCVCVCVCALSPMSVFGWILCLLCRTSFVLCSARSVDG